MRPMTMLMVMWMMSEIKNLRKLEQFQLPMQLLRKTQWWSKFQTHLLQVAQWWLFSETARSHLKQCLSCSLGSEYEASLSRGSEGSLRDRMKNSTRTNKRARQLAAQRMQRMVQWRSSIWGMRQNPRHQMVSTMEMATTCQQGVDLEHPLFYSYSFLAGQESAGRSYSTRFMSLFQISE